MQTTKQYLSDSRVDEADAVEAVCWLERRLGWEQRLAELRRPRPAGATLSKDRAVHHPAA